MSENIRIVREFIAAWARNDVDEIMTYFDAGCVYHNVPVAPVSGTDAIRGVIEGFAGSATAVEWLLHQIAETDSGVVLTERTDRFEIGGRWIELPVMGAFELRGGKITAWRDYFDLKQFTDQMPSA